MTFELQEVKLPETYINWFKQNTGVEPKGFVGHGCKVIYSSGEIENGEKHLHVSVSPISFIPEEVLGALLALLFDTERPIESWEGENKEIRHFWQKLKTIN